jgi:hypothetical protein
MADELYPGYDPLIDPDPITCWGYDFHHESMERARRLYEAGALWFWDDPTKENGRDHC